MTQLFKVTIDSVDVTLNVSGCNITEVMNRFYDVATFTLDSTTSVILEKDVIINYGGKTFTGFVYGAKKTGKNAVSVECRTNAAKLTEPYSAYEETIDDATTSHGLCSLYADKAGVPITINTANLDFGGSYERNGSILSALKNIANVTGAEYYDNSGTVTITPNKAITGSGTNIPDSDIFNFIADNNSVYNKGIGYVTIQNGGSINTDIISINNIYAEIDECTGEIFVFTNPNGEIEYSNGISELSSVVLERKEDNSVLDKDVVNLNGAIESISAVTLNGINVTNYSYEPGHNVIYFTTLQRGTLSVTYKAYAQKAFANVSVTPLGRFISLDLFYLDQVLLFQGFLSPNCDVNASTDGDMTCIVPDEMMYPKGFTVWTIGGVPEFTFFDKNVKINQSVSSVAGDYISVENTRLEEKDDGSYRYRTRYPLDTALEARSAGVSVAYTTATDADGDYFEFATYYPNLVVSYETAATSHYVQFPNIVGGVIAMVIRNDNTGETCEYNLDGINYDDIDSIPCELNQDVPVSISGELRLEVVDVSGEIITYLKPNGTSSTVTVDEFGIAKIYVEQDGDYILDTSALKARTTITLTANVNG